MNFLDTTRFESANRRITLGFTVALVTIVSGFVMSVYSYAQYGKATERVRHTYQVIGTLEKTLSLLKDLETGSLGYTVTSDSSYLKPYLTARQQLPGQLSNLRALLADNPVQVRRALMLNGLVAAKIAATQLYRKAAAPSLQAASIYSAQGRQRMDQLRQHVALMVETENALMAIRNRQAGRSFESTLVLIFSLSLLTFVALALSYRQLQNELTHRQQTEDQLRGYEIRLKEQIRQLEASNQELERFAFVASHDLQEPLRKIQSFASLVTDRYGHAISTENQMFMEKIIRSAERMSKLIKDLLNFSRMSSNREDFKPVHLAALVQRVLDDQELRLKSLNVRLEVGPLPMLDGVASQLDHLFTNLISNALKFLRPGVQPLLRIQARPVNGSDYADLIADRPYVEVTVEDNGIGFDEKYLTHIFKVFQRLHGKTEFEGTGIGLAICKRVVLYHHGFITARSQPNQGTTFVVVLPESQLDKDYD